MQKMLLTVNSAAKLKASIVENTPNEGQIERCKPDNHSLYVYLALWYCQQITHISVSL